MIEISRLSKSYGRKAVLHDLDLSIRPGELYAFLGPNGAGKTTTIKIIAGLVRPSAGQVRVGGFDIIAESLQARALMSYVPDEPFLYDKLTAREFLRMMGELYGLRKPALEEKVGAMAEAFELHGFLDGLCESFSHGMKQRTVLAGALLHGPRVLILDEPMVGLDPRSARSLKDKLRRLSRDEGMTVFMSTHSLAIAEELADRIGILSAGRLVVQGSLAELRALPGGRDGQGSRPLEDLFLELTREPEVGG